MCFFGWRYSSPNRFFFAGREPVETNISRGETHGKTQPPAGSSALRNGKQPFELRGGHGGRGRDHGSAQYKRGYIQSLKAMKRLCFIFKTSKTKWSHMKIDLFWYIQRWARPFYCGYAWGFLNEHRLRNELIWQKKWSFITPPTGGVWRASIQLRSTSPVWRFCRTFGYDSCQKQRNVRRLKMKVFIFLYDDSVRSSGFASKNIVWWCFS